MANKRMFSKQIVDSDAFLDMPLSTQCLYFHLNMRADDDGFINSPKKIMRMVNSSDDDLKILFTKKFVIGFESGVIVIKHWRMHNTLRNDRYSETVYQEEKARLFVKSNNSYSLSNDGCQTVAKRLPDGKHSIDKIKLDKISKENRKAFGSEKNVYLSDEDMTKLINEFSQSLVNQKIEDMSLYCKTHGKRYKDYKAALLLWLRKESKVTTDTTKPKTHTVKPCPDCGDLLKMGYCPKCDKDFN